MKDKLAALERINNTINGCFGDMDSIFNSHPMDKKRAKEIRKLAKENNVTLIEIENIICGYLYRKGVVNKEHFAKQVNAAKVFFEKKLK